MNDELLAYKYLWDGSEPEWVLLQLDTTTHGAFSIFNRETKMVLVIEDNGVFEQVIAQMLNSDVEVISNCSKY